MNLADMRMDGRNRRMKFEQLVPSRNESILHFQNLSADSIKSKWFQLCHFHDIISDETHSRTKHVSYELQFFTVPLFHLFFNKGT